MLEIGDATVNGPLDVILSASFDIKVFRGTIQRGRDSQVLVHRGGEQMIVENVFEKRTFKKGVGEVGGEANYYMGDVQRCCERYGLHRDQTM